MDLFSVLVGVIIGVILSIVVLLRVSIGVIRVDRSIPDEPASLFLELKKSVEYVISKKFVIFRVNTKNYVQD